MKFLTVKNLQEDTVSISMEMKREQTMLIISSIQILLLTSLLFIGSVSLGIKIGASLGIFLYSSIAGLVLASYKKSKDYLNTLIKYEIERAEEQIKILDSLNKWTTGLYFLGTLDCVVIVVLKIGDFIS